MLKFDVINLYPYNIPMSKNELSTIDKARYIYTIYEKDSYSVRIFRAGDEKITCFGEYLPDNKNITYLLTGEYQENQKYGRQFHVISHNISISNDKDNIISFLSSGLIKGIGKKTAERIYELYRGRSLDILKNDPGKLLKIRGITQKKLQKIVSSYTESIAVEELMFFLSPYGFTPRQINSFYKHFKAETKEKIEDNPYILCDFRGVSFKMVDPLGKQYGFEGLRLIRLKAAINEILRHNMATGSVGIRYDELLYGIKDKRVEGLIDKLSPEKIDVVELKNKILQLIEYKDLSYVKRVIDGQIIQYFYEPYVKKTEEALGESIKAHIRTKEDTEIIKNHAFEDVFNNTNITFDETQKEAIYNAFRYKISIITGGPGTGKTTICNAICQITKKIFPKDEITLLAPTGRAARKLAESTGLEANTIHKRLNLRAKEDENGFDGEIAEIDGGTVIIDEFSMVDMDLANILFSNIYHARIIIVGDKDQLESVGAGCVLRDLLSSGTIPVTYLRFTHRQLNADHSTICENADRIRNDITDLLSDNSFIVHKDIQISADYMKTIEDYMIKDYLSECKKYGNSNVILISPFKRFDAGVYSLNKKIQEIVNPLNGLELKGLNGMTFRVGDRVMQLKNCEDLANGDIGEVVSIFYNEDDILSIKVVFENGSIGIYTEDNNDQITLAYATTVHKSQGSEYKVVVMCMLPFHRIMLKRNLIYTGITRAKEKVILYTTNDSLNEAIHNNSIENRHTMLSYYLRSVQVNKEKRKGECIYEQLTMNIP